MHPVGSLVGGGRARENPAGPGHPRPILRGTPRGMRGPGLGHWLCPTCPVIPQASSSPPHLPRQELIFPFSSSSFCCTHRLRPAQRSPGPEQAGGEAQACSGAGEAGDLA